MRRLVLAALVLAACGRAATSSDDGPVARTTAPLIAESERLTGADLPDKHLILTFDDSPVSMAVTGAISTFLSTRPTPIHATFFVDGSCVAATTLAQPICATPTSDGAAVLSKLTGDGHLLGNHTTTARDLVTEVPLDQVAEELSETDAVLAPYVPWNRKVFRAPNGSWIGSDAGADAVYELLEATSLGGYVGPIYWNIAAVDGCTTAEQCGDLYRAAIHARGNGIVQFHDAALTRDTIEYLVPLLEGDGYVFDELAASRELAAILPSCDGTCASCTGPSATQCATCASGQFLNRGACASCLVCPAGSFTAAACTATSNTSCTVCASGTYSASAGALGCATCGDCDDGNDCTTDQCSSTQGCTHTRIANCPAPIDAGVDAAGTPNRDGGVFDDIDNEAAADTSGDSSGCRSAPGRSGFDGGFVVALAILVSVRNRRRTRPVSL